MDYLSKIAQIANVIALLPAGYCAYGTYVLLHSAGSQGTQPESAAAAGGRMVNPEGVLISLGLFLFCVAVAAVLNLMGKRQKQSQGLQVEQGKLVIHSAVYGTGSLDDLPVTDKLRTAVRDALVIPVDNSLVPTDPAVGKVKRLHVEYSYGNASIFRVSRREGSGRLVLPEDSEIQRLKQQPQPMPAERQVWFFSPGICVSLNRSSSAVRVALSILSTERAEMVHVRLELRDTNKGTLIICENSEPMTIEKLTYTSKVIEQKISPVEMEGFVRGAMYQVSGYAKFRDGDKITSQRIEINTIPSI